MKEKEFIAYVFPGLLTLECPNCGAKGEPKRVVSCAERITFFNCREDCGFSTWDAWEYWEDNSKGNKKLVPSYGAN